MFLLSATLLSATPSFAGDADDLIAQGIQLRRDRRDQEAFLLFQQAHRQQPTPRSSGQLGTCEQALGLWVGAEAHIQQALAHPQDSWVQKNETALRYALAYVQQHLGSVDVWGSPNGARISIDGEAVATVPMAQPTRVAVGERAITIDAAGFSPQSRSIEVKAGVLSGSTWRYCRSRLSHHRARRR
jgi:hypothetical protein